MSSVLSRRTFLGTGVTAVAVSASPLRTVAALNRPVRIGLVGIGSRGMAHVRGFLNLKDVEITALCDIRQEQVDEAQNHLKTAGRPKAEECCRGPEDYKRLCEQPDLDAVVTATPWELHAPVMVAAMEAGKYGATEVPAACTTEECWQLVETSERTGKPCMILENVNYFQNVMTVLVMIRQGLFGEMLHCEAGYQHDVRGGKFMADGSLRYRGMHSAMKNGNVYPTHPIGPVAWFLDINRGDRFDYIVSMSTMSRGINNYAAKRFGPDHPSARRTYAMGDINTSLIRTVNGRTVMLYHDTNTPRPYDLIFRVQGTKGIYSGTLNQIYLEDRTPLGENKQHAWEDFKPYQKEFAHPVWAKHASVAAGSGHGGGDGLCRLAFIEAVKKQTQTPIDVYDTATWSVITALSIESVANGSKPVAFPDFTKGQWKTNKPVPIESIG